MNPIRSAATVLYTPTAPVLEELSEADDPRLTLAMEEYLAQLEAGERPDRETFLARHPDVADKLPPLLDNLDFVHQVAPQLRSSPGQEFTSAQPASLGDYRIVREVGRGGMGVVYEAEQISLSRRVALKVLPFAAVMDPRRLARFRNEAQAAATLTHQHIVPVYAVGSAQGVHYYAMQFIDGCTLADMIEQLRQAAGKTTDKSPANHSPAVKQLAAGLTSGIAAVRVPGTLPLAVPPRPLQPPAPSADTVRPAQAAISTENSHTSAHYVRAVTELAVQLAEALDYAHRQGVVHRDIKPGNLLLDMQGNPWITDFGLARIENDTNLTMTGDLVGTLRYMSPEQALAQRVIVDHRTDIYSFGVTLYELLTLEPVFAASGRQELLRDIAFREPSPLRKLQRDVPADLETIVMKAMAKNPAERYGTAQELADDLRRQLADQPIRARRPSIVMRVRKWSRRHRAVVTSAGAVSVCALLLGAGLLWRERSQTFLALAQADANFRNAQQTVDQYLTAVSQSTLLDTPGMEPLRKELLQAAIKYYQTFTAEHANDPALRAELAAAHVRLAHLYNQTGSNQWIDEMGQVINIVEPLVQQGADVSQWKSLREGVLFSEFRGLGEIGPQDQFRGIAVSRRGSAVWEKLAKAHPEVAGFACDLAGFQLIHGMCLNPENNANTRSAGAALYEQAVANWERFPNQVMGSSRQLALAIALNSLASLNDVQGDKEAQYRYAKRAIEVATNPGRPAALESLFESEFRNAFKDFVSAARALGRQEEAFAASRKLTADESPTVAARLSRAIVFEELGEQDQALLEFRKAIELDPNNPARYSDRAQFNLRQGRFEEAIADCNKGIEFGANAGWFGLRAQVFEKQGTINLALRDFSRAIELDPKAANWHNNRSLAYAKFGDLPSALADSAKAIELAPKVPLYHSNRAYLFDALHRWREALEASTTALELDSGPDNWHAHYSRCWILIGMLRYDEALEEVTVAIERFPDKSLLWEARSVVDERLEKYQEALTDMNAAVERAVGSDDACRVHVVRGRLKRRMGMAQEAEADFKLACDSVHNGDWLAQAKAELGRYEEALSAFPGISGTRFNILIKMKRHAQALEEVADEEKRAPQHPMLPNTHGALLAEVGRFDQAFREFSRAIELAPHRVDNYYRRGWVASMQGRYELARNDFEEAIRHDEFDPLAMRRLAWFLATCPESSFRNPDRAVMLAEKAASVRPYDGVFWYTLGVCQYGRGDYEAARAACQRAIEMRDSPYSRLDQPRVATDYDHYAGFFLAMSLWHLGEKEKGREVYAEAIAWRDMQAPDAEARRRFSAEKQAVDTLAKQRSAAADDQSGEQ